MRPLVTPGCTSTGSSRGAVGLMVVLGVMAVLSTLALAYHRSSGETRRTAHRAYVGQVALALAKGAIDETLGDFLDRVNFDDPRQRREDSMYHQIRGLQGSDALSYRRPLEQLTSPTGMVVKARPVEVFLQFFERSIPPTPGQTITLTPEQIERIKSAWREFYLTGVCTAEMDGILRSTDRGVIALRADVSVQAGPTTVGRSLEVRKLLTIDGLIEAVDLRTLGIDLSPGALGVSPTSGTAGFGALFTGAGVGSTPPSTGGPPAASADGSPVTTGGAFPGMIHVSPYDIVRLVDRDPEGAQRPRQVPGRPAPELLPTARPQASPRPPSIDRPGPGGEGPAVAGGP